MKNTLILCKTINEERETVYKAFVKPKLLSKWFTTNAKVNLKVGGKYSNDDLDKGEYLQIKPNQKLKFTWENKMHCLDTVVTIYFDKAGKNKARIRLEHSLLKTKDDYEEMKSGWSWALVNIKLFLEAGRIISYEDWLKSKKIKNRQKK